MSDFIELISKGRVRGVEVNLGAEQILSKLFPDINWLTQIEHPLKISIGFSLKQSVQFVPGFSVINIHTPINRRNSTNSIPGPLFSQLVSTKMTSPTELFGKNRTNAVR